MNRKTLLATAAGIVLGGVIFNAPPAHADWPVIDFDRDRIRRSSRVAQETGILDVLNAMNTVQNTISPQ